MEKEKKQNVLYKIITFPEKMSTLVIYLIIAILFVAEIIVALFALPKVDYTYLPDYQERTDYNWINPYIRSITNYYEDDNGDVYSSMTATICYFGIDSNHKATNTLGSFTVIDENDVIYYAGDLERSTRETYSTTTTPLSRLSKSLTGIKTYYGKVEYDQMYSGVNQGTDIIYFKEDVINLSKDDLKNINYSDDSALSEAITGFSITSSLESGKTKITSRLDFVSGADYTYHFDYQLFGVDKNGKTYDLIGIYNFSNNYSRYVSLDTKVPTKIEFEYFVGVFKIKVEGKETIVYIKKNA